MPVNWRAVGLVLGSLSVLDVSSEAARAQTAGMSPAQSSRTTPSQDAMPMGDGLPMAMPRPVPPPARPMSDSGRMNMSAQPAPGGGAQNLGGPALSLVDLESIALRNNPTLVQAQAQVDASLSKSFQAGLLPNPLAGYVSEQMGAGGGPGETQGWFVEQEIPRGGKLRLSRAKYRQEAVQAQIQVEAQRMRVVNGVRDHYYEVLAARRMLQVKRHLLSNYEEMLRTTKELVNVGQANRPDLLQAQVGAQRQRVQVRGAENHAREKWVSLVSEIGCPQMAPAPLVDTLEHEILVLDWDAALHRILTQSPELRVARAEVIRDEITVQRERAQPVPDFVGRVENGYNWEVNLVTTGVSLGWRFPVWNRNQGTIREAMAEVTRARAEVARLELQLRQRLAEAFSHYQTALTTVHTYRDETLPQALEAYQLNLQGYRQRRTPWAQVVLAERTWSDLNEDYIEALLEARRSEVAIAGMLLTDGLSMPEPPTPGGHIDAVPQPR